MHPYTNRVPQESQDISGLYPYAHECSVLCSDHEIRTGIKERNIRARKYDITTENSWAFCTEHAPNLARNPWGEGVKFNMAAYE